MNRLRPWILLLLVALGCDEHTAPAPAVTGETLAIYEAAIRGAVEEAGYAKGPVVFDEWIIAWEPHADEAGSWQDPVLLERLVARFRGSCIDWEACPENHATGIITSLSEIHRIGPRMAEVGVATFTPGPEKFGTYAIITVRRDAGAWHMTGYEISFIE